MERFLLDTGMLLGLTRKAQWARRTFERLHLGDQETATFTSVICHGEMLALAEKNGWGERRRIELEEILKGLPKLDINKPSIVNAYALIDAWTHGKPVTAPHNVSPPKPAISMGKNDLWIAATAHASKATLLSTDRDFDHLDGVWLTHAYVDPH